MKKLTASLALLTLLVTGSAIAAENDAPPPPKPGFNHDKGPKGVHMRKHFRFKDCDKNNDGAVSQEEFMQCFPKAKVEHFQAMDANKDGKVTMEEAKAWRESKRKERHEKRKVRMEQRFKECDKDGNGALSLEEFMNCGPGGKKDRVHPKRLHKPGERPAKPGVAPAQSS